MSNFICATSRLAVSAGGSGRRHHQAEWCHPAHFIGFIVGSFLFPPLLDSIALWGRPGRPNVTGTKKQHAALKTLFLLLASPLPLHLVVLTVSGITCKDSFRLVCVISFYYCLSAKPIKSLPELVFWLLCWSGRKPRFGFLSLRAGLFNTANSMWLIFNPLSKLLIKLNSFIPLSNLFVSIF